MVSAITGPGVGPRRHGLFGLTLLSDFDFESRLGSAGGEPDLTFSVTAEAPVETRLGEPVYQSPLLDDAGDSLSRLYRLPRGELLRFGDALDFYLGADRVDCHLRRPEGRELIEIRLLGAVLAYWLERAGICALHASAVVTEGRTVAFMATNLGGKSGLAAAMMAGGDALLTDDLLPLERVGEGVAARPGYPQMRMRSDILAHFVDPPVRKTALRHFGKHWVPVGEGGFGSFHATAAPLGRIYLPERLGPGSPETGVRITELTPREAVIELLRCSFTPYIVEAVGLQARRLDLFGRLVGQVPVRRLVYPSGLEALPAVRRVLLEDLGRR